MQSRQKQAIEKCRRVETFLTDNPLPPPDTYGGAEEMLKEAVALLTEHANDRVSGATMGKADISAQRTLRKALREQHLRPMVRVASAKLRGAPGIDKALEVPRRNIPVTELLAVASNFRKVAVRYESTFVKSGLPADFVARLDATTAGLAAAQTDQGRNIGTAAGALVGLEEAIDRANHAIGILDALIVPAFKDKPDVIGRWKTIKRLRGARGSARTSSTDETATTPASGDSPEKAA